MIENFKQNIVLIQYRKIKNKFLYFVFFKVFYQKQFFWKFLFYRYNMDISNIVKFNFPL